MSKYLEMKPQAIWNSPPADGDIGIEVEIEGVNIKHPIQGWRGKEDHSLRGESLEYTTNGAVKYDELPKLLARFEKRMTSEGVEVIPSSRTSTHIHINFQKNTLLEAAKYWTIFSIVEPLLLQVCSPKRDGNLFCLPSYDTMTPPNSLKHFLAQPQRGPNSGKYSALNMDTLVSFGSVECRIFPCSVNAAELQSWVDILLAIKKYALDDDHTTLQKVHLARTMPENVIAKVFPKIDIPIQRARHLVQFGCEQAYEMAVQIERVK
jgi:hypothetical protein